MFWLSCVLGKSDYLKIDISIKVRTANVMAAPNTSKSITNIKIPMMPPLAFSLLPVLEGRLFFAGGLLLEGTLLGAFDGGPPCFAKGD